MFKPLSFKSVVINTENPRQTYKPFTGLAPNHLSRHTFPLPVPKLHAPNLLIYF